MSETIAPVKTVPEYLNEIERIRKNWACKPGGELWFRGEDGEYPTTRLFPKAFRPDQPTDALLFAEARILDDFKRSGSQLVSDGGLPGDRFDWYMLMQHHGGPTRLLDWSDASLVALHFAAKKPACGRDDRTRLVYVLDPDWLDGEIPTIETEDEDEEEDNFLFDLYLTDGEPLIESQNSL